MAGNTNFPNGISLAGTAVTSSAAELNILDGATLSVAELNILDGVTATAAELNILDGVTATAAELNILDGATLSVAELNTLDGVAATLTAAELNILDGVTATYDEINKLDGVISTNAQLDTKVVSVPINFTANTTNVFGVFASDGVWTITAMSAVMHAIPVSSAGTATLAIANYDLSTTTDDNLLSTATVDAEGWTNATVVDLTPTATGADLVLADGDFVHATLVSNNVDLTGGTGGVLTVWLQKTA